MGATDEELDAHPSPGKWSAREIVHHLADSEMTASVRLRLLIAVDRPQIVGFDQDEFARRLHYDRPIEASLDAFKTARRATAELLERMTEADWSREGIRCPSIQSPIQHQFQSRPTLGPTFHHYALLIVADLRRRSRAFPTRRQRTVMLG